MNRQTFTLTALEAAYVVAALHIALGRTAPKLPERDCIIMEAIRDRLAAPMALSDAVRAILEGGGAP